VRIEDLEAPSFSIGNHRNFRADHTRAELTEG
jgi:hypothetical protein